MIQNHEFAKTNVRLDATDMKTNTEIKIKR